MVAFAVGWSHTQFGKLDGEDVESLISRVAAGAIADAGVDPEDIDEIFVGTYNGGLSPQDFPSSLVLNAAPELRFTPATRVENACATGSAAVLQGARAIAAGAHLTLVIGVEKMTGQSTRAVGDILLKASYVKEEAAVEGGFAGIFGEVAERYFQRYGDQSEALAAIAAKNHRNGCANPYAQFRQDLGFDFCRAVSERNPLVAGRLKRSDCAPISDGAAALVLADEATAAGLGKAVAFRTMQQVNDFLPVSRRDMTRFEGAAEAWQRALAKAGLCLADLDFVETHDCFTIAELMQYEAMGLTPVGKGERAVREGWVQPGGLLPVNPSGGLKSKGHPIGATGVSMHVLAAMQLTDGAGDFQVPNARLGGIFNMGGIGVANYVSILERA